jgi:hypothetical protein
MGIMEGHVRSIVSITEVDPFSKDEEAYYFRNGPPSNTRNINTSKGRHR